MDNPDLGSDEIIQKRISDVIINGVWYEVDLTDTHLILLERETGTIHGNIPYSAISLAVSGINTLQEPILTIQIRSAENTTRSEVLVFVFQPAGRNIENLEKCLSLLGEHGVTVRGTGHRDAAARRIRHAAGGLIGLDEEEEAPSRNPSPGFPLVRSSKSGRQLPPEGSEDRKIFITVAVLLVLLVVFVGGSYYVSEMMKAKNAPPRVSSPQPAVTSAATAAPTTTPNLTSVTSPAATPVPVDPVSNGIWVRISYPGAYTGTLAARGWRTEVNASGTQVYNLPVQNTVISGFIEKGDGSGDSLEVEVLNGGLPVSKNVTSRPFGTIEMQVSVGQAIVNTPITTPSSEGMAPVPVSADTTPAMSTVPSAGTFARVVYPGSFSGYINANGYRQEVSGSGDQIYQLALTSGTIDSSIAKQDGTIKSLIVQIYKDGILVTESSTSKPYGEVEIHTRVG